MHVGLDGRIADYTAGGIAQYTRQLAAWLPRLASADRFTLFRARRQRAPWTPPATVRQRRLLTPPHHRWEQALLPLELAPERLDLLHGPDFTVPTRRRCPAIVTVHDLAFLRYPEIQTADSRRHYGQVARVVQHVERVIADSACTAADVEALLGVPPARIRVVHLAPTPAPPAGPAEVAAVRARYELPGLFLLYVGTLEPRKNLGTLLRAFARLGPAEPARLVLAGPRGWLDEPIMAAAERLGERVRLLGPVPAADLPALYAAATAFVYPSLYEGFGLPPLEAMAAGTPVLAAKASCLPEVLGDAALFVHPEDEAGLAEALRAVLADAALRADLRARGLARAATFSWERTTAATLAVYREALGQPPGVEGAPPGVAR
ncbi:MAG TPA: glycosyltransferase family 1 protein [Chloroflexota bacterium]|nr:glycosyltransferase family 1 protein [Chloroflexota bacterium]